MDQTKAHLIQNLSALAGLLIVVIVFAAMGDSSHSGEALAAFVGYAAGSRAGNSTLASAAPIVAAGAVALAMSGCGASFPTVATLVVDGVEWSCEGAEKICDMLDADRHDTACHIVDTGCSFVGVPRVTADAGN